MDNSFLEQIDRIREEVNIQLKDINDLDKRFDPKKQRDSKYVYNEFSPIKKCLMRLVTNESLLELVVVPELMIRRDVDLVVGFILREPSEAVLNISVFDILEKEHKIEVKLEQNREVILDKYISVFGFARHKLIGVKTDINPQDAKIETIGVLLDTEIRRRLAQSELLFI